MEKTKPSNATKKRYSRSQVLNRHITPIPHKIGRVVVLIEEDIAPTARGALVGAEAITSMCAQPAN